MIRTALAALALCIATPALACGGGNCDKANCKMASVKVDATDAMAAVDAADGTKVALEVGGMHCGSCATKITNAVKGLDGVHAAAVDHATGKAKVALDAEKVDTAKLIATIEGLGFTATAAAAS